MPGLVFDREELLTCTCVGKMRREHICKRGREIAPCSLHLYTRMRKCDPKFQQSSVPSAEARNWWTIRDRGRMTSWGDSLVDGIWYLAGDDCWVLKIG